MNVHQQYIITLIFSCMLLLFQYSKIHNHNRIIPVKEIIEEHATSNESFKKAKLLKSNYRQPDADQLAQLMRDYQLITKQLTQEANPANPRYF